MFLADFEYNITYIRGEDNSAADALSRMPEEAPTPGFAACALAHTRHAKTVAGGTLEVSADAEMLEQIIRGYTEDEFCKQLTQDIETGSIEGARMEDELLYVGKHLVIPRDAQLRELFFSLAHDTLGHFGFNKSYEALRDSYYWPNMRRDLEKAYIPGAWSASETKTGHRNQTDPCIRSRSLMLGWSPSRSTSLDRCRKKTVKTPL
jgi:hypothetical protein